MNGSNLTPIAITGIGCRFPGNVTDLEKMWALLAEGRSCWTEVPPDRFNDSAFYSPDPNAPGSHNHRGGHFLAKDIAAFDAEFFRISPAEAQAMDPQQRILLETTYEAFESCGTSLDSIRGSNTAVYAAMFSRDYDRNIYKDTDNIPKYHTTGTGEAILANRISYFFDLKGPSMTLDTGCSGSLVALHQACQSLRNREADTAIAGGVNLILSPDHMIGMANLHMLNKDGRSYSFDSRGSGYGRGEGRATVIVKRLDDAISCGDPIRAVINHTAINQDGKTSGITLPSQDAQTILQQSIYERAQIDPRTIGYVEAHGTGTSAGDLAEIAAIRDVFCLERKLPLHVGSIKSNIGHLESASGLAGSVKVILVLEKGLIPPNANFEVAKAELKISDGKIKIPTKLEAFEDYPIRRASVNSFGYGGTNAHAILERAPDLKLRTKTNIGSKVDGSPSSLSIKMNSPHLFILSAKTKHSLVAAVQNFNDWISRRQNFMDIEELAYTLSRRRTILQWRFAFVAEDRQDIMAATQEMKINENSLQKTSLSIPITFVLTGQGAQWHAMGRELILTYGRFRESILRSGAILLDLGASWDLVDELLLSESATRINQSRFSQPACTAIQIALIDLLGDIGVRPQMVLGHSSGEIAAAYAAEILSQTAAMWVAYYRSFVSSDENPPTTPRGAMLAVGLSEEKVSDYINQLGYNDICVACVNSPDSTTVSGNVSSVVELRNKLQISSIFSRRLNVDTAYHSPHMQEASTRYLNDLHHLEVKERNRSIRFVSTVTALEKDSGFGPEYWVDNLVSKVRFSDAILRHCDLLQDKSKPSSEHGKHVIIEIGPHAALLGPTRQTMQSKHNAYEYEYFSVLSRGKNALFTFLDLAGKLFERGVPLDLQRVHSTSSENPNPRVIGDLPGYSWDHSHRFWHESRLSKQHRFREHASHDLLGTRIASSTSLEPRWRHLVGLENLPWLQDHVVDNLVIFPGAAYLCMAIEAIRQIFISPKVSSFYEIELRNVLFPRALVIPPVPAKIELHISLVSPLNTSEGDATTCREFRVSALTSEGVWNEHCSGLAKIRYLMPSPDDALPCTRATTAHMPEGTLDTVDEKQKLRLMPRDIYKHLESNGNYYGPCFAAIKDAYIESEFHLTTRVEIPDAARVMPAQYMKPHLIHPTTLDALMHSALPLYGRQRDVGSVVPTGIQQLRVSNAIESTPYKQLHAETTLIPDGLATSKADILVFGSYSLPKPVIHISGIELRGFPRKPKDASDPPRPRSISYRIKWEIDANFLSASRVTSTNFPATETTSALKVALLNRAASIYVKQSLKGLEMRHQKASKPHLMRLVEWMEHHRVNSDHACSPTLDCVREPSDDVLLEQTQHQGVEGRMLSRVGRALSPIVMGDIEPLNLMLEDDLLYKFYADDSSSRCYAHLSQYLKYLFSKRPRLRILEIGAGTGNATHSILTALDAEGGAQVIQYDFTEISAGFFDKAKSLLAKWISSITFKTLDISRNPLDQGFSLHSYDLVVAANVLHATNSINDSLANVHRLLKPQGKLVLIELTSLQPFLGLVFGTLPEWWQGVHDQGQESPILTRDQWHGALSSGPFNGLEVAVDDITGPAQTSTFMISSSIIASHQTLSRPIKFVVDGDRLDTSRLFSNAIQSKFQTQGLQVDLLSWESEDLVDDSIYVVVDEGTSPLLVDPTPARFDKIVNLIVHGRKVLWISGSVDSGLDINAKAGLVTGLARTAHAENPALRLVTLDIQEPFNRNPSRLLSKIYDLLLRSFHPSLDDALSTERELIYKDGEILIPRVLPYDDLDLWISQSHDKSNYFMESYGQPGRPLKLLPSTEIDGVNFVDDNSFESQIGGQVVDLDVKAYGVKPGDAAFALGQVNNLSLVTECAGVITATGPEVSGLAVGDRVSAFGCTPYASRVRVYSGNVARIPDSWSFAVGASIPVAFMTAYHCLVTLANLKKDQCIMIHAAAGPVEQAAISIAKHLGSTVIAIVSSGAERDWLIKNFDLSPIHVVLTDASRVPKIVSSITGKIGVDCLLNCSPNTLTEDDLIGLTFGGTIIQTVDSGLSSGVNSRSAPLKNNFTFRVVDLVALIAHKPLEAARIFANVMSLLERGSIQAKSSISAKPIAEIGSVLKAVQSKDLVGTIILESDRGALVRTKGYYRSPLNLDANATYVVAGGVGDLGSRLAELMVKGGAKHIVMLSRRSVQPDEYQKIKHDVQLISPSSRIYWKTCDIKDALQVKECAASLKSSGLPPVKGVVQAAVDRTLSSMQVEDFNIPLQSKFHGTRHLYQAFENLSLDFFIILSSISGVIGASGQANYAAGNAFQDTFANTTSTSKFPCISIDIGLLADAKHNNPIREQNLARHGVVPMRPYEFVALLEYAMSARISRDHCKQIVVGFDWQSLSDVEITNATTKGPLFCHIRQSSGNTATNPGPSIGKPLEVAVSESSDREEVQRIVTAAISRKLSNLVASDGLDQRTDSSMLDLGLDSLITTELRNWIFSEFKVVTQVLEILDQASIRSLASLVASRATFVQGKIHSLTSDDNENCDKLNPAREDNNSSMVGERLPSSSTKLPLLPLPELENTLSMYLDSRRVFLSGEELGHTSNLISEFLHDEGPGQELQSRLRARLMNPHIDSWLSEPYSEKIYLERRDPIHPTGTFYGGHLLTGLPHSQAERAAILAVAAFGFKNSVELGTVERDYMNDEPICMESLHWLFNAVREPRLKVDKIRRSLEENYLIALRHGHFFKVRLLNEEGDRSFRRLKAAFEHILAVSETSRPSLAALTADERDSWAEVRESIKLKNDRNHAAISSVESAAFVMCLDDGEPSNASERCNQFFLGDPSNRWSDKTLQFIVCNNGVSAFVGEHSMLDGMSIRQFNRCITNAIVDHRMPEVDEQTSSQGVNLVEEIDFVIEPAIESRIDVIRQRFKEKYAPIEFAHHHIRTLGSNFLRTHKCPAKAGYQVIIQLACLLYYGYQPESWETISMSRFHKGRVDWIQAIQPDMVSFCAAARDNVLPLAKQRRLFFDAVNTFVNTMTQVGRGHGFKAHLHALLAMVRDDEPVPALFKDQAWRDTTVSSVKTAKTDCLEGAMLQETAFLMAEPKCIFVHFEVEDYGCQVFVQTWPGRTKAFCNALETAAETVKAVLEAGD